MDARVMVRWSRRPEAVWGCNCEMEVSGKRGDFGGCGWKCLGGESVRRWHGGDGRDDNGDVWKAG